MLSEIVFALLVIPFFSIILVIALSKHKEIAEASAILTGFIELALAVLLLMFYNSVIMHEKGFEVVKPPFKMILSPYVEGLTPCFLIDLLSVLMVFVVTLISSMVLLFSKGYMHGDPRLIRYYSFMLLFIGGMLLLVLSGNFFLLYMGWEIVGLCSCQLIGHWFEKPEASKAGIKAFITTRLGDVFLLAGILILFKEAGTLDFITIASNIEHLKGVLPLILLLSFGGAVGKSAQFPLHVWLPDAMEGPTTVSALIHAATMVKAGVYLVARLETLSIFYPHFFGSEIHDLTMIQDFFITVTAIGAFTSFFAATMALVALDIKRVLAYSTLSQLGYMFSILGLAGFLREAWEAWYASQFHLINHAIFKALLFLSSGSVIHALETRDMRLMGNLRKYMPYTFICMFIGALSLAGLVPFNGFWSKDLIIELSLKTNLTLVSTILIVTALLTALYSFRMIYMVFLAPESDHVKRHKPHESPPVMLIPLFILSAGAILSGLVEEIFSPLKSSLIHTFHIHAHAHEELMLKAVVSLGSTGLVILGGLIILTVYQRRLLPPEKILEIGAFRGMYEVLQSGYYFDYLYEQVLTKYFVIFVTTIASAIEKSLWAINNGAVALIRALASVSWFIEKGLELFNESIVLSVRGLSTLTSMIEGLLNTLYYGIADLFLFIGSNIRKTHTGEISRYLFFVFIGVIVLLIASIMMGGGI
ncbi:MAG: NADH-quinone oxidoreductase subunit L [Thermoprotei archaeon]|nr:MAG: NADH-quinone oxidoreductase subunit L [Thermoprotei archaeon]